MAARVLLTGGAGFIGSHTWLALLGAGFEVVGLDNLSNSSRVVPDRLGSLAGSPVAFHEADVNDEAALDALFARHGFDAVVHFAAFKAVGESVAKPLEYYGNNIGGLLTLCRVMRRHACTRLVYSSSATVYGDPQALPIPETAPLSAASVYGWTKLMGERILLDLAAAEPSWRQAILRYFNPVGAHPSGRIGEDPAGPPNNLMPFVAQVAVGRRPFLRVFGNDYPTPDGTGVRDYIHVMDLADGHVAALRYLLERDRSIIANLGTGAGHSVLEVMHAYQRASGRPVPHEFAPRRPGDVAACYADVSVAREELRWTAGRTLDEMCADSWRWQSANPQGYAT
jgi:UDP-glucose 4-epimerase